MKAKILVVWLVMYLLGCFAGYFLPIFPVGFLLIGAFFMAISFLFMRRPYFFGVVFGLGLFCFAICHFQAAASSLIGKNTEYSGKNISLDLRIDDLPQRATYGDKLRLVVVGGERKLIGQRVTGYISSSEALKFGDVISVTAKLSEYKPETKWKMISTGAVGEMSINKYEKIGVDNGIVVRLKGGLLTMRQALNDSISRALPAAEAGLGSGIILGERALMSPEMTRILKASGTTHIIALSGYNITVILGLFILVRNRWGRLTNLLVPSFLIALFVVMTGGAPSLVRAAIMGSLPLLARFLSRESDSFISILLSAALMAVFNPFLPLFDVGFQLSFVAFAGIIYIAPLLANLFKSIGAGLSSIASETIGAQLSTLPLLSYYFGMVSVISPLSNMIILGILPVCMAMSFATGLAGIIWQPLGNFLAIPTYYLLHFVNTVIAWTGNISWASVSIKIENPWWILIAYILIFDIWFIARKVMHPAAPTAR